jgi:ArsR family transcriptional regulator
MNPLQFYKCLADDTRLRCLLLITQESELCVCELTAALQDIQPKISRHLAHLRKCGLLSDRKQGQWVFYRLCPDLPEWATMVLRATLAADPAFLRVNSDNLARMGERPARMRACSLTTAHRVSNSVQHKTEHLNQNLNQER